MPNIQSDHHSFFILADDKQTRLAEITFVYTGDELAIIDHTVVDESLKGKVLPNNWSQKSLKECVLKSVKLFLFAHSPKLFLIKHLNTKIFATNLFY